MEKREAREHARAPLRAPLPVPCFSPMGLETCSFADSFVGERRGALAASDLAVPPAVDACPREHRSRAVSRRPRSRGKHGPPGHRRPLPRQPVHCGPPPDHIVSRQYDLILLVLGTFCKLLLSHCVLYFWFFRCLAHRSFAYLLLYPIRAHTAEGKNRSSPPASYTTLRSSKRGAFDHPDSALLHFNLGDRRLQARQLRTMPSGVRAVRPGDDDAHAKRRAPAVNSSTRLRRAEAAFAPIRKSAGAIRGRARRVTAARSPPPTTSTQAQPELFDAKRAELQKEPFETAHQQQHDRSRRPQQHRARSQQQQQAWRHQQQHLAQPGDEHRQAVEISDRRQHECSNPACGAIAEWSRLPER